MLNIYFKHVASYRLGPTTSELSSTQRKCSVLVGHWEGKELLSASVKASKDQLPSCSWRAGQVPMTCRRTDQGTCYPSQ